MELSAWPAHASRGRPLVRYPKMRTAAKFFQRYDHSVTSLETAVKPHTAEIRKTHPHSTGGIIICDLNKLVGGCGFLEDTEGHLLKEGPVFSSPMRGFQLCECGIWPFGGRIKKYGHRIPRLKYASSRGVCESEKNGVSVCSTTHPTRARRIPFFAPIRSRRMAKIRVQKPEKLRINGPRAPAANPQFPKQ